MHQDLGLEDAAVLMAARMLVSPMPAHAVLWTIRSMIASAVASAPSRACQPFCRYWVQKIVNLSSQRSPEISGRKRRKPSSVLLSSHPSRTRTWTRHASSRPSREPCQYNGQGSYRLQNRS